MGETIKYKNDSISKKFIKEFLNSDFATNGRQVKRPYLPDESYEAYCPDCTCCQKGTDDLNFDRYPDANISYKLNNYGYRSDNFNKLDLTNFLFAGCSFTFGVGLPLENVWCKVVHNLIGIGKFYNLGSSGSSYQSIIQSIYSYIDSFGKAENIFILLPNIERYDSVERDGDRLHINIESYSVNHPALPILKYKKIREVLTTQYVLRDLVNQMRALYQYCEALGVKLYWSTWDQDLEEILTKVDYLGGYIPIYKREDSHKLLDFAIENGDKKNAYWQLARDGHPGIKEQLIYAKVFLDAYEKNNK